MSRSMQRGWAATTLRWLWGADDDAGPRRLFAETPATWLVLTVVCAVSLADFALGPSGFGSDELTYRLGFSPALVADGQWWRLVTQGLVNPPVLEISGISHLSFNAVGIVLTGPRNERAFGSMRLVLLFLVAQISASVSAYAAVPIYDVAGGGTSGGMFGLAGGALAIAAARRRRSTVDALFLGTAVVFIGVVWLQGLLDSPAETNISHLGGFIAGMVLAGVWMARPASRRVGAAVVVALTVIAGSVAAARTFDLRRSDLNVVGETDVGFAPVMVTEGFGSIWVTGGRATGEVERDEVVRIDPTSGRVTARIREPGIGGLPVVTEDRVWVTAKGTFAAIDPASNRVVSRIRLSGGAWPWSAAATKEALWAAVSESGEVIRIDLATLEQKSVAVGDRSYAVIARGERVWATSFGSRTVVRLDPETGAVLRRRMLADAPYHAVFLAGSLWVGAQPFVYRLDPDTLEVTQKIRVGGDLWTMVVDGNGNILLPQRHARAIVVIDPASKGVTRRLRTGLRGQPTSLLPLGDDLWIAMPFRESVVRASAS